MGENTESEPLADAEVEAIERDDEHIAQVGDPMLRLLIKVANQGAIELGVTLMIGSGAVTGRLVGLNTYLEGLQTQFDGGGAPGVGQAISETWTLDDDEDVPGLPNFVHLADAKWFTPDGQLVDISVWRGRVSAVEGWSLGSMSQP